MEFDADGNPAQNLKFNLDKKGMILRGISKIENLNLDSDGKEMKIETAEQLCETPELSGLYKEVSDYYLEINRDTDKKKLK